MASLKKKGKTYYAQYYLGKKQKRVCLHTSSLQVAKEKLRQVQSALPRGNELPLPTKTPVSQVVAAYVEYIQTVKTFKSAQTDFYYLREAFGPACDGIQIGPKQFTTKTSKAAAKVERYREKAPQIRFLRLNQIDEQLEALKAHSQLQTMVALYIYSGLRREKALNRYQNPRHSRSC